MTKGEKKRMTWLAGLLTASGGILLALIVGMLVLRYRALEVELDRMLTESLTAHTQEAGKTARDLIDSAVFALEGVGQLVEIDERAPEESWVTLLLETANLGNLEYALEYHPAEALEAQSSQEQEFLQHVLENRGGVSGLLPGRDWESSYILAARAVTWEGKPAGVLTTRLSARTLTCEERHSSLFHSVYSVIAGEDGLVVYGSIPETQGVSLTELSAGNGVAQRTKQDFTASYQEQKYGSFNYDATVGRCYTAWAPLGWNNWRVVQFSQSPNVQIERSSQVQAAVMVISLAVCCVLAAMIWRQRARLAEEKLRYDALAEFKDTLLFEYNCEDDSLEFTSNALDILDLDDLRLTGVTDEKNSFPVFHPEEMEKVRRVLRGARNMTRDQIEHDRTRMKKRGGEYIWYRSQYKAVFTPEGRVIRVIGTLTDISAQMIRELELRQKAQQDPLTGLYNRAGVDLINARLEQISRGLLFMLDMDDFKSINDNYGHAAGDKVLIAIARVLEEAFRADDIVARVGGDEFVAFLSGSDNAAMAQEKAQELLDRVQALRLEGIDHRISVSIGIASAPAHGRTFETLSACADEAMYDIKNSGKGGYALK